MTHWDGLVSANTSGEPQRILVLGATNRIQDIDEAILRRMPKKFPVPLPTSSQRRRILKLVLRDTKTDPSGLDIDYLVRIMAGMSGSDIKEACRDAAMGPVREYIRNKRDRGVHMENMEAGDVRGLRTEDFFSKMGGVGMIRNNLKDRGRNLESENKKETRSDASSESEDQEFHSDSE